MKKIKLALSLILITAVLLPLESKAEPSTAITGVIVDASDGTPISHVTVQLSPSGNASISNDDGRFRLLPEPGDDSIRFSHVAYQTLKLVSVDQSDLGEIELTPALHTIRGLSVYERSYDRAQSIIMEAIRRKEAILARIENYKHDAYLKFIARDISDKDSTKIFFITESQTTVYWQSPNHYKEIITARKASANINVENTIVGVGEMLNFNKNRIDLQEYKIVSPTASDALDYYNYYLIDTILTDDGTRYVLEVEPKNQLDPLFEGTIHIIDSTYDVVLVDVGFNQGVQLPMISELRYQQRMARFESTYWVPVEISFGGDVSFGLPFPGIPSKMNFEYLASLYSFEFDQPLPEGLFDEYELEITETADEIDSVAWDLRQSVPLSAQELAGYVRLDSVAKLPASFGKKMLMAIGGAVALSMGAADELFHFNRVEGPYFGIGGSTRKLIPNTRLSIGAGYADDLNGWQYHLGFRTRLAKKSKLHLSAEIKDRITKRPSVTTESSFNATAQALLVKYDPFNYYDEKGVKVGLDFQPIKHHRLGITANRHDQVSVSVNNRYSVMSVTDSTRSNPDINDGRLGTIGASWRFDSRQMIRNKGLDMPAFGPYYFTMALAAEVSSPDLLGSNFDFKRYTFSLYAKGQLFGSSETQFNLTLGYSNRSLPAQRLFTIDLGAGVLMSEKGFNTVGDSLFFGDRVASAYLVHDLGREPFARVPLPLIKEIPFGLMIHGGLFWSSLQDELAVPVGNRRTAIKPYSEAGITFYNLTPFLSPLDLAAGITWQLSDYYTNNWQVHFGVKL